MSFFIGLKGSVALKGCEVDPGDPATIDFSLCGDCEFRASGPECCFYGFGHGFFQALIELVGHVRAAAVLNSLFTEGEEEGRVLGAAKLEDFQLILNQLLESMPQQPESNFRISGVLLSMRAIAERAMKLSMEIELG
ncbi:MAG: hypothetical protein CVV64_17570 [Candidatus Wallbacteria bacterium HGW-Wallbacteria-1]|jgi:hypothetical protein|uniref:Uncharacterized protein n=1 Tax=Candidatus Wallbacteria bacterium HGW-Wallbacteria-1 TaxID=2013854 RepID=A0A2N1PK52_9BACT|nr:MAG: hypothetical protein CVV64_17570 [Candidatus Wallbacteria bacterium HGW-Wallbacteria-1]